MRRRTKIGISLVLLASLGIYAATIALAPRIHDQWGFAVAFLFFSLMIWGMVEEWGREARRRELEAVYGLSEEEAVLEIERADRYERLHGATVSEFREFLDGVAPEDFERFAASDHTQDI